MATFSVWLKSQLKKTNVWLNNQPWWKSRFTASTPPSPASSSNLIFKFILWTIIVGIIAIVFTSRYVSGLSGNSLLTIVVIGLVIALAIKVFRSGPSGTTKWYNNSNYQNSGLGVVAVLIVLKFAFHGVLWDRMWANGILFVIAISVLIFALFHMRKNKAWIALAILILLFTSEHSWNSRPEKVDKETQNVLAAQEAGKRSGVVEIDTIIEFNGTNEFVFELGDHMFYDIRAITTGEGFWWRKDAVIYFQIPSGAIFRVDEEGHAFPIHDSTASPKSISSGKIRVWGTGTAKIKTFWKEPKYVTASK